MFLMSMLCNPTLHSGKYELFGLFVRISVDLNVPCILGCLSVLGVRIDTERELHEGEPVYHYKAD